MAPCGEPGEDAVLYDTVKESHPCLVCAPCVMGGKKHIFVFLYLIKGVRLGKGLNGIYINADTADVTVFDSIRKCRLITNSTSGNIYQYGIFLHKPNHFL